VAIDNLAFMYKHSSFDETLTTAVRAISLASYAHLHRSGELDDTSRFHYTRAIGMTNAALRSPTDATKDSTLLAILILGMYEVLTGTSQKSVKAWMEHVRGSAALLKLRGYEQLETPLGRRLFVQANTGILTTSLQLNVPIPKSIMEMVRTLPDRIPVDDDFSREAFHIHLVMLEINQFRAAVERGKIRDLYAQLTAALRLDQRLVAIYKLPTPEWQYHTVSLATSDNSFAYKGRYHVYGDLLTANMWNAVRVHRGLLHERIRELLLAGFTSRPPIFTQPEHTKQLQSSMDVCYAMQAEILASVPQHLGYVGHPMTWKHSRYNSSRNTSESSSESDADSLKSVPLGSKSPTLQAMADEAAVNTNVAAQANRIVNGPASGGLNLMWPLFFAGCMDIATAEVQAYTVRSLRVIGEQMGIRQALLLARVVESQTSIEAWAEMPRVEEDEEG
jgi:hypothetical protein